MPSDVAISFTELSQRLLNEPQASLLSGILFGSQVKLPADFSDALKITGTYHVVAVSGQNMSILAGFLGKMTGMFGWKFSLVLQGAGILGYIFLVGGGASVIRSGLMALIALFAQATGRQQDAGRALLLTAFSMVLLRPEFLTEVGWQLSVLATAGIIWLEPIIADRIKMLPKFIAGAASVSLAAQLLTWPIIAYNFQSFSVIALPANVLTQLVVPWIMGLGAITLLVSQVWLGLGVILSWLTWVPLTYFVGMVESLSKVPGASLKLDAFPLGLGIIYYTLVSWGTWRFLALKRLRR